MPDLTTLIARRATAWAAYQELLSRAASAEALSAEDRTALDAADTDIRSMSDDIERLNRAAALDAHFNSIDRSSGPGDPAPAGGDEATADAAYAAAFDAFLRRGISGLSAEQRQAIDGSAFSLDGLRAQGVAVDSAGGYLAPASFRQTMTETMKFFGGMASVAQTITTTTGSRLPWATNDDTGVEGAYLTENTQMPDTDLTFGGRALDAFTLGSKVIKVSFALMQDSAFDLGSFVPRKAGERIARRGNRAFTTGTGVDQPLGVTTNVTTGKTGAGGQTTSIIYDDLVDLEHSVDPAYRNERSRWMFHDLTLAKLRKLKDSTGAPLWEPSLKAGAPDTFNGRLYTINNDMPQMAASAKSVLFGDFFAGYIIRVVAGVQVLRLTERYADYLQVGFLAFERHDGMPDDPAALRAYVNAAA